MRFAKQVCAAVILLSLTAPLASAQDFSTAMRKIFGKQFKDYQWLDYPLDNFGVATAYRDTQEVANPKRFRCATFTCLNIHPVPASNEDKAVNDQWLHVSSRKGDENGYADAGCGPELTDLLTKNSKLAITAFLPKILGLIGISSSLQRDKGSATTLEISSACSRLLNGRIDGYIAGLQDDVFGLKAASAAGELVLIKGDVVVNSFEIKLKANQNLKAELEAKLQGALTKKFGDDAKLGVTLERDQSGDYHLKTTSPVIVGVLAVRQPKAFGIGPQDLTIDVTKWHRTEIPLPSGTEDPSN
jgi:hypothetical protein